MMGQWPCNGGLTGLVEIDMEFFDTFSNGSRERHPAELKRMCELCWICECDVWLELTAALKQLSCRSRVTNAQAANM